MTGEYAVARVSTPTAAPSNEAVVSEPKEREYKAGDKVWFVPGYSGSHLIAIRCTIEKVEDCFRQRDPRAYLFYDLDEPIGHSVAADELFDTREQAESEVADRINELRKHAPEELPLVMTTLDEFRQESTEFILSTWPAAGFDRTGYTYGKPPFVFPVKEHGTESGYDLLQRAGGRE